MPDDAGRAVRCFTSTSTSVALDQERLGRPVQVALAVRRVLEQLPVARQVPLRRRDVAVRLDRVEPRLARPAPSGAWSPAARARSRRSGRAARRTPSRRCRCPARRRRTRRRRRCGSTATARRPRRRRSARRRCRAPAGGPAPASSRDVVGVEQPVQLEVPRLERVVRGHGQVRQLPDLAVDDRRRDAAVVEQRGVGGEPLLAHQLLVAERALLVAERGVPLRRDLADLPVVRHQIPPIIERSRPLCAVLARVTPCRATCHQSSTRPGCDLVDDAAIFPPGNAPLDEAAGRALERRQTCYAGLVGSLRGPRHRPARRSAGPRRRPGGRGHRRRRAARRAARAWRTAPGSRVAGVEIALRDLDDLAGNARRVVAAVDAARAEGVLDEATTVHVELPATEPSASWLAAADEVAAAELRLKSAPAAPTPPRSRPRPRSRSGSTPRSTGRRRSSAPPGCTRRSGTATPRPASSTTASSTCWSPPSSSSTAAPSPRPPRRSTSTTRRS